MNILQKADKLVNERMEKYGDPRKSWVEIAEIYSKLMEFKLKEDLNAIDCLLLMKVVKLVREKYEHKMDNILDETGYCRVQEILWEGR